ncbi:MAG: hypothetical protein FGM46_03225 [Ferruginibacter sp.]|nr:hypothetical protein [Ferruginibacter sp.]
MKTQGGGEKEKKNINMQKTILIAFASMMLITAVSCKKSSTDNNGSNPLLTVRWNLIDNKTIDKLDGVVLYENTQTFRSGEWYEFTTSNIFNKRVWEDDGVGGGQFVETPGTYVLNGSKIKINETMFDIKILTPTTLTLYQKDEQTVDGKVYSSEIWLNLSR